VLRVLFTIGVVQVLAMAVLLARTKLLAVILGPELVGVLAVVDKLVAVLVQAVSLSLPFAALRFLPGLWESDRPEFFSRLRAMSWTLAALSLAAAVCGVAVTMMNPAIWGEELRPYRLVLVLAFLAVPVQALVPFIQNGLAAGFAPHRSMLFYLAHAVVFTVTAAAGAWWTGLSGIYGLYAVAGTILVGVFLTRLNTPPDPNIRPAPARAFRLPSEIWRFGFALLSLTFLAPYAALYVHYRVLSQLGAETSGWMQAAMGLSLSARAVLGAAHPIFLTPNVNRGGTPEARMEWAVGYQQTLCFIIGLSLPPLLLFPDLAVRVLYSSAFLPGAPFVFAFVLGEIVLLLSGTYGSLVLALDRVGFHVVENVIAQVMMVVVGWAFIPRWGIGGAAAAALASAVFLYLSNTIFLRWSFGLRAPRRTAFLAIYLTAGLTVAGLLGRQPANWAWQAILLRMTVHAALVAGLVSFLTPEEKQKLRALARRAVSGVLGPVKNRDSA
jgi:PST family polysaccharide transporter